MPTTETDRQLHQQAQDIHLALGAAIEYDDTSMLADAVATSRDLFFLHTLSDIDALWRSMFQIKRALKDELNPDLELLRRSREQASVVVAATDPDTPDVATGPFSAYITETIVHRVTVEQDFLDNLPHVIRQEDPTDLGVGANLGDAILEAFVAGAFGSEDETFVSCDERTVEYDHSHPGE